MPAPDSPAAAIKESLRRFVGFVRYFAGHPVTQRKPAATLKRWLRWQLASRLLETDIAVPFIEDAQLLVRRGMRGATGNVYFGLHEWSEMLFLLHLLRPDDLFLDIGANIGSYTILASKVAHAGCIAVEPIPSTRARLRLNLVLNGVEARVTAPAVGVAARGGVLRFTDSLDTMNHITGDDPNESPGVEVRVEPIDALLQGQVPILFKLDVEGYELQALSGADKMLSDPRCAAGIVEMTRENAVAIDALLRSHRFGAYDYVPSTRTLVPLSSWRREASNTIYVRDIERVASRVGSARRIHVAGMDV